MEPLVTTCDHITFTEFHTKLVFVIWQSAGWEAGDGPWGQGATWAGGAASATEAASRRRGIPSGNTEERTPGSHPSFLLRPPGGWGCPPGGEPSESLAGGGVGPPSSRLPNIPGSCAGLGRAVRESPDPHRWQGVQSTKPFRTALGPGGGWGHFPKTHPPIVFF